MKTIQNFAEHPFHFPQGSGRGDTVVFPRANLAADGKIVPSSTNVDEETIKLMKGHPIAKAWFGNGALSIADEHDPEATAAPPPPARTPPTKDDPKK